MRSNWDEFTKNAKENLSDAAELIADKANNAKAGAKELLEIIRLKNAINEQDRLTARLKAQIGQLIWDEYQEGKTSENEAITEHCQEIAEAAAKVAEFQKKIDQLREDNKKPEKEEAPETVAGELVEADILPTCANCGNTLSPEYRFCPVCGAPAGEEK